VTVTASPTLTVGGAAVATSTAGAASLVAIDAVRVSWGRGRPLEATTPATCDLAVLDTSPGYTFARRTDLIGQLVEVGWVLDGVTGVGTSGVTFRGRVTDTAAHPVTYTDAQGRAHRGYRVTLAASSIELDLAQTVLADPSAVWPAESFLLRSARLAGYIAGRQYTGGLVLPAAADLGIRTPPVTDPSTYQAAPVDPSGKDVLALLRSFFTSLSPLAMQYDPNADALTYCPRHRYPFAPPNAGTAPWAITPSVRLVTSARGLVAASLAGLHLDGDRLTGGGAAAQALDGRLTAVKVKFSDGTAANADAEVTVVTNEGAAGGSGSRVLSVESHRNFLADAQTLAAWYADVANYEARWLAIGPVEYSTAREPLADPAHAAALLSGHDTGAVLYVNGSWLPDLGVRPLYTRLGGVVAYAAGEWTSTFTPGPVIVDPYPRTWGPVTAAVASTSTVDTLATLHPALTVGDIGWVDVGAHFTASTMPAYPGNPT
jgi:hypothetical protein